METESAPTRRLAIGFALSLVLHVAAGALLILSPSFSRAEHPASADAIPPPPPPMPADWEPKLGIERSDAATITWIGYDEYREHLAPKASIDQPETSLAAVAPSAPERHAAPEAEAAATPPAGALAQSDDAAGPESAVAPLVSAPDDIVAASPPAEPIEPLPLPPAPEPFTIDRQRDAPDDPVDRIEEPAPPAEPDEQLRRLFEPREPDDGQSPDEPAQQRADSEAPATNEVITGPPAPEARPARPDPSEPREQAAPPSPPSPTPAPPAPNPEDRESEAFSTKTAIRVDFGQPVAAAGLRINTVRPRWSHLTRLTAAPREPLVEVRFRRDGRVHKARFIQSTGNTAVDQPLMHAIYNWTAQGEALEKLPETSPAPAAPLPPPEPGAPAPEPPDPPTITITFRIGLRG